MKNQTRTISYGVLAIPIAFLGLPLYIYLPNFYVQNVEINVAVVGIVLFLARVFDMIADPFIGRLCDKNIKRKSMILFGSVFILIGFYFLSNPNGNSSALYLFFYSILTYIGFSMMSIPYLALNAQLAKNEYDSIKLSFSREVFTIVGSITALSLPYFFNISQDASQSLKLIFNSLLIITPIVVVIFMIKIEETKLIDIKYSMKDSFKKFYQDFSSSKEIFLAFILNNLANAIPATLFLFFVKHVLEKEEYTGALLLLYFSSAIIALPLWLYLAKKFKKANIWIISILSACITFSFVPFLQSGDYVLFAIICFISGLSLGADLAIPTSIQADIAKKSQSLGNEVSGLLFGFWAMFTKLSLALAVVITFIILELVGFDSNSVNNTSVITISLLYSILPITIKLLAIYFIYTFNKKN